MCKSNKGRILSWIRTVTDLIMVPKNIAAIGVRNWTLRFRVIKIEQWGELSVAGTEYPSMPARRRSAERERTWTTLLIFWY